MYSKTCYIKARVTFLPPSKGGRDAPPVISVYHPRIELGGFYWSVWIETTQDRLEVLEFDNPYEVKLRLPFCDEIESFIGKTIETMFQVGAEIALSEGTNKIVAYGTVLEVAEGEFTSQPHHGKLP